MPLDGEWEFYGRQLLTPINFHANVPLSLDREWVSVPGPWNSYVRGSSDFPGSGYGTYRLTISVPYTSRPLALQFSSPRTAHQLWVNGRLLSSAGVVAADSADAVARYYDKIVPVTPENGKIELVLQVSNYLQAKGGVRRSIRLGDQENLELQYMRDNAFHLFTFGALCAVGLFSLTLFAIRRSEKAALVFSLSLLTMAPREITLGSIVLLQSFPALPQEFILRMEYFSMFGLVFYAWFIRKMLPERIPRPLLIGVSVVALIQIVFIAFSPVWFFSSYLSFANLFLMVLLVYLLLVLCRAAYKKDSTASPLLFGHICLMVAVANDQLYYSDVIQTGNYYWLGLLFLTIIQFRLILQRFLASFATIEKLNIQLAAADKMKDEFLAEASHELLTPVHGIHGLLETIRDAATPRLTDSERQALDTVLAANRRLRNLVTDIQTFLKLKYRDTRLEPETISLHAAVEPVIAICRMLTAEKPLLLLNDIDPGYYIRADRDKLQQILHNLVENAVKHVPAGEVRIYATPDDRNDLLTIHVVDTGPGIPPEYFSRIFEPYIQVPNLQSSDSQGSGLGLSIVKKLVEWQGGTVQLQSSQRGAHFSFTLPAVSAPATAEPVTFTVPDLPSDDHFSQPNSIPGLYPAILIVDDEPLNLEILEHHFQNLPYQTIRARTGREALEQVTANDFDLVILDLMLPDLSGYEVCRRLRERFTSPELPILILTVRNKPDDIVLALSTGANDYLSKPFDKQELLARVGALLSMKKSLQQAMDSQRDFLLAQIKPHFFYNVINTIMGFCLTQPEKAHQLLGEFSTLISTRLRFGESEHRFIQLGEELAMVTSYLTIEQARFGDLLRYEIHCDAAASQLVPPLILEPLVENAVKHGIYEKTGGGRIRIYIQTTAEGLKFTVTDDGVGIAADRLQEILAGTHRTVGIGLSNIRRRLELDYSQPLHIESVTGSGTTVWFLLPLIADPLDTEGVDH